MIGYFNIRNNSWDPSFLYHSIYCDTLTDIADFMNLCISNFINQVPTRYLDNQNDSNLVINFMFLQLTLLEFNNHTIHPEYRLLVKVKNGSVKIVDDGLNFYFRFLFYFLLSFSFSIFRTTQVRGISHAVTSVTT